MPPFPQRYNDDFRGWPVSPQHQQHPVRGTFLDPRPDPTFGAIYHTGVDVAVRDDRPEQGAPSGRTHRVFAIEGGVVDAASSPGTRGSIRIGHFGYGHVDARVKRGDRVRAGQFIGWTTKGSWHVHLTEFHFPGDGTQVLVNPLRPGGKLKPYTDTAPPVIHDVRFYTPATPPWSRRVTGVAQLPPAGKRLDKSRLTGVVDVRARVSDPQSFIGWFKDVPLLAAPHHPYRLGLLLIERPSERVVLRRTVYIAAHQIPIVTGQHYAPGTRQNHPARLTMSYGWPVKPFDEQHPVRGFFCDPRIGAKGSKAFHFGVDVSAPDGTAVYAVAGGTVHSEGAQNVGVVTGDGRSHGYWHIVKRVRHGQRVRKHQLLGHIARGWGHVHFAERIDRHYWNPLREGALTPFHDYGRPVIDRIVAERGGRAVPPDGVTGVVNLIAVAHDNPPISAPPPWRGLPVTPALVRWRLVRDGRAVIPWRIAADFRSALWTEFRFHEIYAGGTRQNHPNARGRYRFWLARAWDTRDHRDGHYRLDVEAADIRGNAARGHLELVLLNGEV